MIRNFILFCFGCVCSFVLLGFLPHCFTIMYMLTIIVTFHLIVRWSANRSRISLYLRQLYIDLLQGVCVRGGGGYHTNSATDLFWLAPHDDNQVNVPLLKLHLTFGGL